MIVPQLQLPPMLLLPMLLLPLTILLRKVESKQAKLLQEQQLPFQQEPSVQGNPDYEPDDAKVPLNENIVWKNEDSASHTSTSGTGVEDPNSGKIFDTSIINGGEESSPVQLTGVKEGDEIPYYCQVHPFMTSKLTVVTSTTDDGANSKYE